MQRAMQRSVPRSSRYPWTPRCFGDVMLGKPALESWCGDKVGREIAQVLSWPNLSFLPCSNRRNPWADVCSEKSCTASRFYRPDTPPCWGPIWVSEVPCRWGSLLPLSRGRHTLGTVQPCVIRACHVKAFIVNVVYQKSFSQSSVILIDALYGFLSIENPIVPKN